jgi:2-polyprenyl-6-hydroxyphenyl methylase/3-demethylubiquinone-9 3-methyltransferase
MAEQITRPTSVDPAEVARFERLARTWWDPNGPMRPLHRLNPVRLAYIRDRITAHFGRDAKRLDCLKDLRLLDIGCGGGLLSEPLARLGADVVGADPAVANLEVAQRHAASAGLAIDYRATTAEDLSEAGERFDVVLARRASRSPSSEPNTFWGGFRAAPISGTSSSRPMNWQCGWSGTACV